MFWKTFPLFFDEDGAGSGGASELAQDLADMEDVQPEGATDDAQDDEGEDDGAQGSDEDDGEESPDDAEGEPDDDSEGDGEDTGEEGEGEGEQVEEAVSGRPTVKQIKSMHDGKYKDLFKDIPYLKQAFFEHSQLAEVFPDATAAKEAASKAEEYDIIENSLVAQGNPDFLVKTLAQNAPKALRQIATRFADTLRNHDEDSYRALANPIIEEVLYHAARYGTKTGGQQGKNILLAARHIANFMWANGGEIPDIEKRARPEEESEEVRALRAERMGYQKERFQSSLQNVQESIDTKFRPLLALKLEGLTNFEKRQVVRETRQEVNQVLLADKPFQNQLRTLWRKAGEDNYSPASLTRIENAWLARARTAAPAIRNRLRQEAIDSRKGSQNRGDSNNDQRKRTFGNRGGQNRGSSSQRVLDPKKIDWKKTSDVDILGDDTSRVALRK